MPGTITGTVTCGTLGTPIVGAQICCATESLPCVNSGTGGIYSLTGLTTGMSHDFTCTKANHYLRRLKEIDVDDETVVENVNFVLLHISGND